MQTVHGAQQRGSHAVVHATDIRTFYSLARSRIHTALVAHGASLVIKENAALQSSDTLEIENILQNGCQAPPRSAAYVSQTPLNTLALSVVSE